MNTLNLGDVVKLKTVSEILFNSDYGFMYEDDEDDEDVVYNYRYNMNVILDDEFDYFNNMDILENKNKRSVYTDVNGIIHYLLPIEIIYVQVNDKLCTIYTFDEPVIVRSSLSNILKYSSFLIQVHKQYLVNNLYVKSIKRYQLTLINDLTIPVSQKDYLLIKKYLGIIK